MVKSTYKNILERDGTAYYLPNFIPEPLDKDFYTALLHDIEWEEKTIKLFGKETMQPRKIAYYGDTGISYTYSNLRQEAKPWVPVLIELKKLVEAHCKQEFNSVLLNMYRSDRDSMSWHSDNEKELGINPTIASISFGESRIFQLRHTETKDQHKILLESGSLLIMTGSTQHHWKHQVPKRRALCGPRINLTFRKVIS